MTKKKLSELYEALQEAQDEYDAAERKFLNAAGWDYSSSHPDFCWRWSKTIEGRNYSLSPNEAVQMERRINDDL